MKTIGRLLITTLTISAWNTCLDAQTFNSGSTGADGALNYTTPGTYVWDPKSSNPPLDADGDGIFNFTTITIAAGVTLKLQGDVYAPAVYWLASGAVKIDGTIDLSGQNAFLASSTTQRTMTVPGSGGYAGGYPGVGSNPPGAGLGPRGGSANLCGNGGAAGNPSSLFAVPLIGGSGAGGCSGYAGAAGGGAILIASSVSIGGTGGIYASGGSQVPNYTGAGAGGGAIRVVAPSVTISNLRAGGGVGYYPGGNGVIRIEAFQIGAVSAAPVYYTATPYGLFLPTSGGIPSIRVASVGGVAVPNSPTGSFTIPDVTVNSSSSLTFNIQAQNVPLGTIATLTLFSENGPDQVIQSIPLTGTLASSTATATATLPPGFSRGFVKVNF